ncbi:MAG TPA: hypothetical protein VH143_29080 [Kofleriaceae bacterium]|jgi:hypothetical protein|nr:hypothetical protein [Kofleriaceae bacterium]
MRTVVVVVSLAIAATASAQSVNIAFGSDVDPPSASYAAAGAAGAWNRNPGIAGQSFDLVGLDGAPNHVSVSQTPTTSLIANSADPSVTGDDAALLDNGLVTTGAETCLSFSGFAAGSYEVLIYAWSPDQPSVKSRTRQDEAPSTIDVGGAWTGAHVEGVTYARYIVELGSNAALPAHSGLATDMPSAALNGIQIRPLSAIPADAGVGPGDPADAGGNGESSGDAGTTTSTPASQAGCATAGRAGWLAAVVLAVALARRRRVLR